MHINKVTEHSRSIACSVEASAGAVSPLSLQPGHSGLTWIGPTTAPDPEQLPATSLLIEQGGALEPACVALGNLANLISRTKHIVSHAMEVGDFATAAMVTESFCCFASSLSPEQSAGVFDCDPEAQAALHNASVTLVRCVYPKACEAHELPTNPTSSEHLALSDLGRAEGQAPHQNIDDELMKLSDRASLGAEAA